MQNPEENSKIVTQAANDPAQLRMWVINQICENPIWRDRMPLKEFTNALIDAAIKIEHYVLTGESKTA